MRLGVLLFRRPSDSYLRQFLESQAGQGLTYPEVAATAERLPDGYDHDFAALELGRGQATFLAARTALSHWAEFDTGWTDLYWPQTPLEPGRTVAVVARSCGLRFLNACRIVYVIEEPRRFGFAYGTLPVHAESGEERFQIVWRPDDTVHYEVAAFFRPRHALVRAAWPILHSVMNRFRRDSAQAMRRAVAGAL